MKKLILGALLLTSSALKANQFVDSFGEVVESFKKHPLVYVSTVSFLANLDKRYVQPNYYGMLVSSSIFLLHRLLGGQSSVGLNAGVYVASAVVAKIITKPIHNKWENTKRKAREIWQNW